MKLRSAAKPKDLRFKAWLAETLLVTGAKAEARTILVELEERDLLPDAYAFHALAKLSSGTERYEYARQDQGDVRAPARKGGEPIT